ncbi:MAG: hypothetical protein AB2708_20095 [Candidatus Thiodiazotropha taylori]
MNHFVILLKMSPGEEEDPTYVLDEIEEQSPIAFLEDSDDDSFNDTSLINDIIDGLNAEVRLSL